ncbi:MAG: hypothetical protein FJX72_19280 [Armatimonadetes bacterium]|nr:hypothetical protein [Armatimonadota bacterium]
MFGCSIDEVKDAINKLCAPDPESRTKEHEGRRMLSQGQFLYWIPTWAKYNSIRNEVERREQNREAQKRWRERHPRQPTVSIMPAYVSESKQSKPMQIHTDTLKEGRKEGEGSPESKPEDADGDAVTERDGTVTQRDAGVMARDDAPLRLPEGCTNLDAHGVDHTLCKLGVYNYSKRKRRQAQQAILDADMLEPHLKFAFDYLCSLHDKKRATAELAKAVLSSDGIEQIFSAARFAHQQGNFSGATRQIDFTDWLKRRYARQHPAKEGA